MFSLDSTSPERTREIGAEIGRLLQPGDLVNLNGELGSGKTLFVKGLGTSLGIPEKEIVSPTFVLINEYEGRYPLYHFDFYRLEGNFELETIGYLDYFYGEGITAVEWGDLFVHYLPEDRLDVTLEVLSLSERRILVTGRGRRGQQIVRGLRRQG